VKHVLGKLLTNLRFGNSYDPVENPTTTRFYVDIFMELFRGLKLPKMHIVGHHAGSSMALELASVYPEEVFTCTLSAPAMATKEEQAKMFTALAGEWNKPKEDGSHLSMLISP
jgi:pimeloyl-ACP methyl ester carboxylesterase